MTDETTAEETSALRPLSACVAGSGVMTLGVLQFLGQVWNAVPDPARQELLVTVRVAFVGFLIVLSALVLAWLGQRVGGSLWRGAITLFGLFAFAGNAFSIALGVGRALGMATPLDADALPPDNVQAFLGAGAAALLLMGVVLGILTVRHFLREDRS